MNEERTPMKLAEQILELSGWLDDRAKIINILRDDRDRALKTLGGIHLMVMKRETVIESEIAEILESEFGFTPPRVQEL